MSAERLWLCPDCGSLTDPDEPHYGGCIGSYHRDERINRRITAERGYRPVPTLPGSAPHRAGGVSARDTYPQPRPAWRWSRLGWSAAERARRGE